MVRVSPKVSTNGKPTWLWLEGEFSIAQLKRGRNRYKPEMAHRLKYSIVEFNRARDQQSRMFWLA